MTEEISIGRITNPIGDRADFGNSDERLQRIASV